MGCRDLIEALEMVRAGASPSSRARNQVRRVLYAGGKGTRTLGPASKGPFQDSLIRFPGVRQCRSRGGPVAWMDRHFESAHPLTCLSCRARRTGSACSVCRSARSFRTSSGLFGRSHVPDAGGREWQLVRHRPKRGQSIPDGVGHQAADRGDRALAGALDAERVAR
jgi:hypothetical protein